MTRAEKIEKNQEMVAFRSSVERLSEFLTILANEKTISYEIVKKIRTQLSILGRLSNVGTYAKLLALIDSILCTSTEEKVVNTAIKAQKILMDNYLGPVDVKLRLNRDQATSYEEVIRFSKTIISSLLTTTGYGRRDLEESEVRSLLAFGLVAQVRAMTKVDDAVKIVQRIEKVLNDTVGQFPSTDDIEDKRVLCSALDTIVNNTEIAARDIFLVNKWATEQLKSVREQILDEETVNP